MRRLLLIAGLLTAFAAYADVYRWVDEDGTVHFSDRPRDGAEEVELREAQTFSAPVTRRPPRSSRSASDEPLFRYVSLEITEPTQEETLWNIEGQLDVSMRLSPSLQPGHRIRLYLDGAAIDGLPPGSTQARLTEVFRGSHSLRAEVLNGSGTSLIQSDTVNFVVQATSVQNPNNPSVPRPSPR